MMNLKTSLDLSSEMHCILNREGIIKVVNSSFCQILQKDSSLIQDTDFIDLLLEEDKIAIRQVIANLIPGQTTTLECKILNQQAEPIQLKGRLLLQEDDIHLIANISILQDAPLARFRRFFDMSLLDIVVIVNQEQKIIYANKNFSETLGYSWKDISSLTLPDFIFLDDRPALQEFLFYLIQHEGTAENITNRSIHISNENRWIYWKAIYAKGYFYCIGHDITDQKIQELKIQDLLKNSIDLNLALENQNEKLQTTANNLATTLNELEVRNFELDQFVYRVSHDLRAPLTSILGIVNLARLDNENTTRLFEYFGLIEKSTFKLDKFIRSLLDYSRGNRLELVIEKIDFEAIIQESFNDLKYMRNFDRIEKFIHINITEEFHSDSLRLNILFNNLISNAIKYQSLGREHSFLQIDINSHPNNCVEIVIEDNGIGIKQEYLESVFNMFFRASESSEGSGLGLYIVKQTVDKLNGHIEIESVFTRSTLFRLILPNLRYA